MSRTSGHSRALKPRISSWQRIFAGSLFQYTLPTNCIDARDAGPRTNGIWRRRETWPRVTRRVLCSRPGSAINRKKGENSMLALEARHLWTKTTILSLKWWISGEIFNLEIRGAVGVWRGSWNTALTPALLIFPKRSRSWAVRLG